MLQARVIIIIFFCPVLSEEDCPNSWTYSAFSPVLHQQSVHLFLELNLVCSNLMFTVWFGFVLVHEFSVIITGADGWMELQECHAQGEDGTAQENALISSWLPAVSRFSVVAEITKHIHCLDLRNHMYHFSFLREGFWCCAHTHTHAHPPRTLFSIPAAPLIVQQEAEELCKGNDLSRKHARTCTSPLQTLAVGKSPLLAHTRAWFSSWNLSGMFCEG